MAHPKNSTASPTAALLDRLESVKRGDAGWSARCPGHDDQHASLSINEGDDGRVLIHCHAGCEPESIVSALGMTLANLFPSPPATNGKSKIAKTREIAWPAFHAETRALVADHVRVDQATGKRVWWRRPDGSKGLPEGVGTADLALYGADRLDDAPTAVVTEGEPATDALRGQGITAVGTVTGASGCPGDAALRPLVGMVVPLWPDNDAPGEGHMAKIAASLRRLGCRDIRRITWPDAPEKGDAADAVALSVNIAALIAAAEPWVPESVPPSDPDHLPGFIDIVRVLPARAAEDPGAPFETDALGALAAVRIADPALYQRAKAGFKASGIYLRDLEREIARHVNGSESNEPPDTEGLIVRLAGAITTNNHFAQDAGERLYVYRSGVYRPRGDRTVKRKVKGLLDEWDLSKLWSSHLGNEVVEYIRLDAPDLWEVPPTDVLNVADGLLDISNVDQPRLLPHSPEHLSQVQLPAKFDPEADCPRIKAFRDEIWPDDNTDMFFEMPGVLMVPGLGKDKALLLISRGGTGKSTKLRLDKEFLGPRTCCAMTLQRIEDNRFALSKAVGKLVNICADLPSVHLETSATFKMWTGGDALTAEYKFGNAFEFEPYTRLVFSANYYPKSKDASEAFFDRWIVIEFVNVFRGTSREKDQDTLIAEMTTPAELSGMLNEALRGLKRFKDRGNRYFISPSMQSAWSDFKDTTDPLTVWLYAELIIGPQFVVAKADLLKAYNMILGAKGLAATNNTRFGRDLKAARPAVFNDDTEVQRKIGGNPKQWCWAGVGLKATSHNATARRGHLTL